MDDGLFPVVVAAEWVLLQGLGSALEPERKIQNFRGRYFHHYHRSFEAGIGLVDCR
jgi:hypothetical protein